MTVFRQYAEVYDLLYEDKDYGAETGFVDRLIKHYAPHAKSILDLGCGTGRHAIEFAQRGYRVHGVDISPQMVERAQTRLQGLPAETKSWLSVAEGDVSRYAAAEKFDAVTALFHVACYQTGNRALRGLFETARNALNAGGIFVFDFWYGPAVLIDRPTARTKTINKSGLRVTRATEPVLREDRDVVEVNFTVTVVDEQSGRVDEFREMHAMRYMFLPELELLAAGAGLELVATGQWLSGEPLNQSSWLGYGVARAGR